MPAYDFDTYPADFVIHDPDGKCFTLASEFRGIDDCCFVEIARRDRDMPESNDGHDIRNGQHAKVWDGNGRLIGMNTVFVEKTGLFKAPGGSQITLERVEITGVYVGYVSSQRLQPGGTYIRDHGDKVDDTTCSKGQDHRQDSTGGGFGPGTMVATQDGEIPVEWLQSGDMVLTRDHGYQPIVWIARARLPAEFFVDNPTWCPVSLPPACLGYDLPTHRLELMAGHGVVTGNATIKQCGFAGEVLSPASAWRDAGWAEPIAPEKEYTITHLFCAHHQIILAQGAWVETLYAGGDALQGLSSKDTAHLKQLLGSVAQRYPSARPYISHADATAIISANGAIPRNALSKSA